MKMAQEVHVKWFIGQRMFIIRNKYLKMQHNKMKQSSFPGEVNLANSDTCNIRVFIVSLASFKE